VRSFNGLARQFQPVTRTRPPRAPSVGFGLHMSVTTSWVPKADIAPNDGFYFAEYAYARANDGDIGTGSSAEFAAPSGSDNVSVELLTRGAAEGSGPYSTAPVQLSRAGEFSRWIYASVWWRTEGGGFAINDDTLVHPDFDIFNYYQCFTDGRPGFEDFPYGTGGSYYAQAWDDYDGPVGSIEIPGLTFGPDATSACWIVLVLHGCNDVQTYDTYSEFGDGRRIDWSADPQDLLLADTCHVPGGPVTHASPWSANSRSVSV